MLCRARENFVWDELWPLFQKKCKIRGIEPDLSGLVSENLRDWNRDVWADRLGPMLRELPDFEQVWRDWIATFQKLAGKSA
jgi:hypothetical protein